MANSFTDKYKKRQPAAGDLNWDDEINQNQTIDDVIGAARDQNNRVIWGLEATDGGGLSVDYAAGRVEVGGSIFEIAAGSKTAVDDTSARSVNYLYVDSSGVVQINQTAPTGVYAPIAIIDVSSGDIDRIGDFRQQPSGLLADETLAEINKIIETSADIVDVFLYDTSQDSDGGAWRERTENTTWFQDSGKFPALVFIVVEGGTITLYDATDIQFPIFLIVTYTITVMTSVTMLNGLLMLGTTTNGIISLDFLAQTLKRNITTGLQQQPWKTTNIAGADFVTTDASLGIVDNAVNDVSATVLPRAPVNQSTGLQVPTIAVATGGGTSVITDNGDVWDSLNTNPHISVDIIEDRIASARSGANIYMSDIPTADGFGSLVYGATSVPSMLSGTGKEVLFNKSFLYKATDINLILIKEDPATPVSSMVNYITKDYQSGWMKGDIKGAWMADTTVGGLTTTDTDRSVNANDLTVTGTITKAIVETGAELVNYSGFGISNYMSQAYNTDFNFGTGDFYFMGWMSVVATDIETFFNRGSAADGFLLRFRTDASGLPQFLIGATTVAGSTAINTGDKKFVVCKRVSGVGYLYINGLLVNSGAATDNVTGTDSLLFFGVDHNIADVLTSTSTMALWRVGAGDITDEQISHIYDTEKHLFQENAACTFGGTSDGVAALAHDKESELLYVGTGDGVSVFKDLNRVDYIDTTGIPTSDSVVAVSAAGGAYVIGNDTEAIGYIPEANLREEITRQEEGGEILEIFWFDGDTVETDFAIPAGWRPKFVYEAGLIVKEGSGEDYTITFDGFIYTVVFASAPAAVNIGIMGVKA